MLEGVVSREGQAGGVKFFDFGLDTEEQNVENGVYKAPIF